MKNENVLLRKNKKILPLFLAGSLGFSLISCGSDAVVDSSTEYRVTQEGTEIFMTNNIVSPHWFPEELLKWTPEADKNLNFNKSVVPLADKVEKDKLEVVNETQNKNMDVVAISIMNSSTSGNPSRGSTKFSSNTFSYWQYIDKLVYWGGSSGEGLIVPPTPDVTDSAHTNGVPVLGTVFFPTLEHGGKLEWLDTFLTKDAKGGFPVVDKLIQVATEMGFDGWFINQETQGTDEMKENPTDDAILTPEHSKLMQELIKEFKTKAGDKLEIMWYDSMTEEGEMDWQNALTQKNEMFLIDGDKNSVADSMFLNFWWTEEKYVKEELIKNSNKKAKELGIDPYSLFTGIDTQANGTTTPIRWDLIEESANNTYTSLGLYCPSWTFFSSDSPDSFQDKESKYWVNELGNPAMATTSTGTQWRGISTYKTENTVINALPFNTNFNIGNGYNFFIDGELVSKLDWNNRSMADVMPTYRWMVEHEGNNKLTTSLDFANAYYGGNSIKLYGNLDAAKSSTIKLFSSELKLTKDTKFETAARGNDGTILDLVLEFEDGSKEIITADNTLTDAWQVLNYDVSKFADKTMQSVSYKMSSDKSINGASINIGSINITDSKVDVKTADVTKVTVEDTMFEEDDTLAGVKLSWESANIENISHYEIYRVNSDKTKSLLGATPSNDFFINSLQRDEVDDITNLEIVAVNTNLERGESASANFEWPDNDMPKANFAAGTTLIAPGGEVKFENLSSVVTESIEWYFEGATTPTSTEDAPTVKYDKAGIYDVKIIAKNEFGETEHILKDFITVSDKAKDGLVNLGLNQKAEASSFVNPAEGPEFALDGKSETKWCATGKAPHTLTVDLGEVSTVSGITMLHAQAGGENEGMNTEDFSFEYSLDGKIFEPILVIEENELGTSNHTFKATEAKFIRININKPSQGSDSAARIYDVQIQGIKGSLK
ncbi:discoidin domain-containing protein [uncultured Clostridium sp.]|jgi:endo-beta-N-acetylglucosaminidase D/PKD repeat protein|uniref:endo-beta-N-acetylglucosaminidase n=1 Tax=uncultured Clostridium sp. TaxID=59620 RepID=UPI002618D749|nr:discoidin domain-containing protein [uncultured Clostridium sp.]